MAKVRVINNFTGAEGEVDETWLVRWPEDFTPLSDDHVPLAEQAHIAELLTAGANEASEVAPPTPDPAAESSSPETPPSDGTTNEEI